MTNEERLKEVLRKLSMEVYAVPLATDDTLVMFARIQASPALFQKTESRVLYFIEKMLQRSEDSTEEFKIRLSRPWVLKEGALRYTWDFTFKGDLSSALDVAESIKIPEISQSRIEEVATQLRKASAKGNVKPVTVGNL